MRAQLTVLGLGAAGLMALSLLPAQAQPQADDYKETPARKEMRKCFRPDDVDGFNPIDSDTLVVETTGRQHYKLTLAGGCFGIDSSLRIGIRTRGGMSQICGGLDGEIIYNELGMGRVSRCAIVEVTPIDKAEADRLEGTGDRKSKKEETL